MKQCTVLDCKQQYHAKGLCRQHYEAEAKTNVFALSLELVECEHLYGLCVGLKTRYERSQEIKELKTMIAGI